MNTPSLFTQVTSVYDDKLKWTLDEALGGHKQAQLVLWCVNVLPSFWQHGYHHFAETYVVLSVFFKNIFDRRNIEIPLFLLSKLRHNDFDLSEFDL